MLDMQTVVSFSRLRLVLAQVVLPSVLDQHIGDNKPVHTSKTYLLDPELFEKVQTIVLKQLPEELTQKQVANTITVCSETAQYLATLDKQTKPRFRAIIKMLLLQSKHYSIQLEEVKNDPQAMIPQYSYATYAQEIHRAQDHVRKIQEGRRTVYDKMIADLRFEVDPALTNAGLQRLIDQRALQLKGYWANGKPLEEIRQIILDEIEVEKKDLQQRQHLESLEQLDVNKKTLGDQLFAIFGVKRPNVKTYSVLKNALPDDKVQEWLRKSNHLTAQFAKREMNRDVYVAKLIDIYEDCSKTDFNPIFARLSRALYLLRYSLV